MLILAALVETWHDDASCTLIVLWVPFFSSFEVVAAFVHRAGLNVIVAYSIDQARTT